MVSQTGRHFEAIARPAWKAAPPARITVMNRNTPPLSSTKRDIAFIRATLSMDAAFEISRADILASEELAAGSRDGDPAVHHDMRPMSEPQRMERVLLDQEHRKSVGGVELADRGEDLAYDQG